LSYFKITSHDDERTRREKVGGKVFMLDRSLEDAPDFFNYLAECLLTSGNNAEGLAAVERGESLGLRGDPDLLRVKGELLRKRQPADEVEAEACFRLAIERARRRSTKSIELLAATSLARLLRDTNRRDEARTMLADIYHRFTEGFDTADVKDAIGPAVTSRCHHRGPEF